MQRFILKTSALLTFPLTILTACGAPDSASDLDASQWGQGLIIRSDSGWSIDDITDTVNQYRADLGGDNNLNAVGTQGQGHREINWDGVPANLSAPQLFPGDFFKTRGLLVSTPGQQLQVSAKASEFPRVEFGNIKQNLPQLFKTFSPEKLFASLSSTQMHITFTVPGSLEKATVTGFGAVFTDVDLQGVTKIDYFDMHGKQLASIPVAAVQHANETLSFLGVKFTDGRRIATVRLTTGNVPLWSYAGEDQWKDLVALDDFLYSEPKRM